MAKSWAARLAPAATFQFCFIGATAMLKPGANALVLSRFQAGALPYLYMAAAAITGLFAAWTALRPGRRMSPGRLAWTGAALAGVLTVGVQLGVPLTPLLAYLFAEAFATQVGLAFWGAMGEAFDARESRSAFTWVSGIGMSGAIGGGLLAQVLARTLGALSLLAVGAGLLGAAAIAWRFHRSALESAPSRRGDVGAAPWQEVADLPYVRWLAALVLGFSLVQQLTDFVFRQRAVEHLAEAGMADVFASHQLWTGVFCVIFQLLIAERLMRRVGILRTVGLVPALLAIFSVAALAWPEVWSAWGLKLVESWASWSLLPVAMQLLYAPLPDSSRDQARRVIDGFLRKGGMGLAGLLLAALAGAAGADGVLVLVLLACSGLFVALWQMGPLYLEALHTRVAGVQEVGLENVEERMLVEALKSPGEDRPLRAAELLENAGLVQEPHVRLMLVHPHERVQEKGVKLARAMGLSALSRQLELLVGTAPRRPRDEAAWALAQLAPERARAVLPAHLGSSDVGLKCAALGGLLSLPGEPDALVKETLQAVLSRGPRAPAAERREVARLMGRLADQRYATALSRYLEDSDPSVRRVAIAAVGEGAFHGLAPRLLRFLSWRDERRAARDALARLGDEVVPLLASTLDDRTRALSLRVQLPRVLRLIGTQQALDALLFSNAHDEPALHYRVGLALARLHDEHPRLAIELDRVHAALVHKREAWRALVDPWADVRAALGESSLLTRVMGDRLDQSVELSFWLLGLTGDTRSLRRAHAHLVGAEARRRAWALEWLENLLPAAERALVDEQLERYHRRQPLGEPERLLARLPALCLSDDSVLRACARRVGRQVGAWSQAPREDDMSDVTLERLFALEGVEIFAQSDVDDLAAVAAVAREHRFRTGERIYGEGDPGDALYVIVEGSVAARRDGEVVLTMKAKESFGETSLFDGAPRINEVVALEDTRALVIDRRDFLDLLADRPELLSGMFRVLSRQLKHVVVEMANRRGNTGESLVPFDVPVPPMPRRR